ncbi:MAG: signal peptidase II [Rhodospirillales bacterium]|nr:signal peptidase II [Rhodospirillales bacterium]
MRLGLSIAVTVAALDQLSKWAVLVFFMDPPRVIKLLPFLDLVLVYNRGASFGFLNISAQWVPWLLTTIAAAVVIALIVWLRRAENRYLAAALGLIIGGAVGNGMDRVLRERHAVVDFIDLYVGAFHWPAFNVADSAIVIGVFIMLYDGLIIRR